MGARVRRAKSRLHSRIAYLFVGTMREAAFASQTREGTFLKVYFRKVLETILTGQSKAGVRVNPIG